MKTSQQLFQEYLEIKINNEMQYSAYALSLLMETRKQEQDSKRIKEETRLARLYCGVDLDSCLSIELNGTAAAVALFGKNPSIK